MCVINSCFYLSLSPKFSLFAVVASLRLLLGISNKSFNYLNISSVLIFEIYGGESFLFVMRTRLVWLKSIGTYEWKSVAP